MVGYSDTPLPAKLGIRPEHRVVALRAPADFARTLGPLPPGVELRRTLAGRTPLDAIVLFVRTRAELERRLPTVRARMAESAGFWVAWPKRASGVATDVTEDVVRAVALPTRLVDNKVCAIDATWSALRLVIRREHRKSDASR